MCKILQLINKLCQNLLDKCETKRIIDYKPKLIQRNNNFIGQRHRKLKGKAYWMAPDFDKNLWEKGYRTINSYSNGTNIINLCKKLFLRKVLEQFVGLSFVRGPHISTHHPLCAHLWSNGFGGRASSLRLGKI